MRSALSVGEFARMTHLSIKTLRHYHEVGLLLPAEVDAGTGYRWYTVEQVPVAQVVRRLRDLEMPVAEVRDVLRATDLATRNRLIAEHLTRLEARLTETQRTVASLRDLLGRPRLEIAVERRSVPAQRAIAVRDVVDRTDLVAWWLGALGELRGVVAAAGAHRTGPTGGLFTSELYQHDRGEAVLFVPVDTDIRPIGRAAPITVPSAELAIGVHRGALEGIDVTYGELGTYTARHEISVDGPLREYYLYDPLDDSAIEDRVTEVGWPIFRAGV